MDEVFILVCDRHQKCIVLSSVSVCFVTKRASQTFGLFPNHTDSQYQALQFLQEHSPNPSLAGCTLRVIHPSTLPPNYIDPTGKIIGHSPNT